MSAASSDGATPDRDGRLGLFRLVEESIAVMSDAEKLELIARIAGVGPARPAEDTEVVRRQRETLDRLIAEMEALPCEPNPDGFSGRDHDKILYGLPS